MFSRPVRHRSGLGGNEAGEGWEAYDAASNRLYERRVHEPSGSAWKGDAYTYDGVYRLITRKEGTLDATGALTSTNVTLSYTLDGLGSWKSWKRNITTYANTLNSLNQYTVFKDPSGQRSLGYEFRGNLGSDVLGGDQYKVYDYDFASRLVSYRDPSNNLTRYRYDALGRRISKNLNGWTHTRYVYDGDRLIEERDGAGAVVASYLYGAGPDEVLSRRRWSGGTSDDIFYHTNALGSVTAVTDSAGAVVERYKYDAYGAVTFLSPTFVPLTSSLLYNNVLFTGRYLDTESGLYNFRAREYHPLLGRFLQRDPLGEAASLNLYAYVNDNPINFTDPTGLFWSMAPSVGGGGHFSTWQSRASAAIQHDQWRQGFEAEQAQAAEDAMGQFSGYHQMERDHDAGIQALENAYWAKRAAAAQAKRNEKLKTEIETSLKNPDNMKNMASPKGVVLIVYGWRQRVGAEHFGREDDSKLDTYADDKRRDGYVVIEVSADYMASASKFSEMSQDAVDMVAAAVRGVTDQACGNMSVQIDAFSRGGGGAVGVTNALTGSGAVSGGKIKLNLIDPYMGDNWNTIDSMTVQTNVYLGTRWNASSIAVNWGAHMLGLSNRSVLQGGQGLGAENITRLPLGHTRMDTYVPRTMGIVTFLGF